MSFWSGKRIFLTGHTGFKGSWLTLWLDHLGANVTGYGLAPINTPNMFESVRNEQYQKHYIADIRDHHQLRDAVTKSNPDIIFHFAAQSLVVDGYKFPRETFSTNVMGTVNVLDSIRDFLKEIALVIVTSDKCYKISNKRDSVYTETDPLGGDGPYSSSKSCAELVSNAYWQTFFNCSLNEQNLVSVATARAGNAIGGGDYGKDRLIPDAIEAWIKKIPLLVRNPEAIRPWQHVLDTLSGYILLAEHLYCSGERFSGAWNFGPDPNEEASVSDILRRLKFYWGADAAWVSDDQTHYPESTFLRINSEKAKKQLGWDQTWGLDDVIEATTDWYKKQLSGADMRQFTIHQIEKFMSHG